MRNSCVKDFKSPSSIKNVTINQSNNQTFHNMLSLQFEAVKIYFRKARYTSEGIYSLQHGIRLMGQMFSDNNKLALIILFSNLLYTNLSD